MKTKLLELGLHGPGQFRVSKSGCLGRCKMGPCLVIYPDEVWYSYTDFADMDEIIDSHLLGGRIVERLLIDKPF
jgi:(2Fe-2S) ferredoxin